MHVCIHSPCIHTDTHARSLAKTSLIGIQHILNAYILHTHAHSKPRQNVSLEFETKMSVTDRVLGW